MNVCGIYVLILRTCVVPHYMVFLFYECEGRKNNFCESCMLLHVSQCFHVFSPYKNLSLTIPLFSPGDVHTLIGICIYV